ncbi:MAG: aminoacyl-tRNA hydrolase [Desulfovibrio sp.]
MADYKGVIVGLGNPGLDYVNTRHNIGFDLIDYIVSIAKSRKSMHFEEKQESGDYELYSVVIAKNRYLLLKPLTYMNLSGKAVAKVCGKHTVSPAEVIVAHDELDLSLGRMKLKKAGGNNGHRGLESIDQHLGTNAYYRLRIGIGRPEGFGDISKWVLGHFSEEEREVADKMVKASFKGVDTLARRGQGLAVQYINSFRGIEE